MNLDMEKLLDAVRHVESAGDNYAVSPKGAKGPYQFMDGTAKQYGVDNPYDERQSRDGARRYLNDLLKQFDGNVEMALAAYNGGPGRLEKTGRNIAAMPLESRNYISKVVSQYASNISQSNGNASAMANDQQQPSTPLESLFPSRELSYRQSHKNLFPANHENDVLTASILQPKPVNEAQRIYEMQMRTGLPVGLIERNLDEIENKAKKEDFDAEAFRKQSPLLAEWMVKNPVGASLAQGDYENLSFLEKTMATFRAVPAGVKEGMLQERLMMLGYKAVTGVLTPAEEMEHNKLQLELQELEKQAPQGLPNWFKEAGSIVGLQIPLVGEAVKQGVQLGLPAGAAMGAAVGALGGPVAPGTVPMGAAAGGVLGFKAFTTASFLEQSYRLSVGEAFLDLKDAKDADGNPIDPVAAKYASLLVGLPNAALEFASLRAAVKVIPGADKVIGKLSTTAMKEVLTRPSVAAALANFGKNYAAAVGTETFTEGMQKLLVILTREITTGDMGEGLSGQDVKDIGQESLAAFKGSVVLGALASGPKVIGIYADMEKAAKNEEFMHNLGDATANSKTFANSPKAFADYIAMLKENGPVKNVFIPIETWNALFEGKASDAATEVFGSTEQYAEAQTTGSDLVIPLETYAEKLAGTEYHEKLVPNIRLNPGEMTPTEAAQAKEMEPEIAAGVQAEMEELITKEAPLLQVYTDVYDKMIESGASTQEATRDASIWRARIEARAERLGVDPVSLYQEEPLILQREVEAVEPEAEPQVQFQSAVADTPQAADALDLEGGLEDQPAPVRQAIEEFIEKEGMQLQDYKRWDGDLWLHAIASSYAGTETQKNLAATSYLQARGVTGLTKTENGEKVFAKIGKKFDTPDKVFFQPAFHGSPFKFDKFTTDHIGAGEGAQAYGWGLYFAGKKEISEWYRENTLKLHGLDQIFETINGEPVGRYLKKAAAAVFPEGHIGRTSATMLEVMVQENKGVENLTGYLAAKKQLALTTLNGKLESKDIDQKTYDQTLEFIDNRYDDMNKIADYLAANNVQYERTEPSKGQLYEVDLPGDDVLLNYEETYENQPPAVQAALDQILATPAFYDVAGYHESQVENFKKNWDGARWYDVVKEVLETKNDKDASLFFNELGIKGLKYHDATSRGGKGDTFNYVIFDDSAVNILQTYYQEKRGFSIPTQHLIALLKDADPSTFVHESGHVWFEEMRMDALRPDAPDQLKADWETLKEWTGATDEAIPTDAHEMFARGLEAYVMDGNSPSFKLREVFAQFKDWLSKLYKSFEMLDVQLTPEVREVMDRMLATDELIKETRERGEYHIPLIDRNMMTEAEYEIYRDLNIEAKREAEDSFRAKVMKELKREKLQAWRDEKKALAPKVRAEILEMPIHKAAYWLWSGKLPDGSVIEGLESHKLDKQALIELGVDPKDLAFRYTENGLHPDVVADMFGFKSGESMVREMVGLQPLQKTIEDEVNRRIREEHGGIIVEGTSAQEAAMEVQNTRQIEVFNMELRLLKRFGARREQTHPAYLKELARKMIERKTLREIDPRIFEDAALKAGQEAQDALLGQEFRSGTGRNLDVAFDAKQRQLLNVFLSKEAWEKRSEADKAVKKWKKFLTRSDDKLSKSYNMDMVNAARAIASVHGIGGAAEKANAYMASLAKYDPQTYEDMKDIVELASGDGRKIDDMTVADFAVVKNAIEGLWTMARRSKQIDIDGVKMDRGQVVGELNTRIGELVIPDRKRAGYDRAMTAWDKTKMAMLGARAMLRRVEHWVDAMDDGKPDGQFRKYIWQPISEAADMYRDQRRVMLEKYQEVAKRFPEESSKTGKIDATEIGYEFKDKAELLGALLHTGNESNLQKLLRGREWGAIDQMGELDSRRWDSFIARMQETGVLTKADYDFIQGVWDLFDEIKPQSQQAHKEMYGYYFEEITHKQFKTPFGEYKGGYYPATVDPFIVEDVSMRGEKEALESQPSSYMFPTTGRGFTKQRQEQYARPLRLDLGIIPQQLEKVLRFTHLEPRIKDVARVVIDKDFRSHLSQLDTEIGAVMLVPWLQRSASQKVEQPSGPRLQAFDQFFHGIRTRTGLQIMALNVSVALQQFTGIGLSALKVKPRHLAGALWHFTSSPSKFSDNVRASSTFMRNRTATQLFDIQKSIDYILLNPSKYQKAKDFANQHAYFLQGATQNVVDMVTWGGAYEQATAEGHDEKSAVRIADSAVRETQGTFAAEDISRFEAGPAHLRAFTMFYSYFNMAANLNGTEFVKMMRKSGFGEVGGRALYLYTFGFMIPAVVSQAIVEAMSGDLFDDDDDDGYLDNLLDTFFTGQARMATAFVPVIGPVVQVGINQFNDKWYDDKINVSPAVSALEAFGRIPYDAYKAVGDDDPRAKGIIKDIFTVIGIATGLPVAPLAKPITYLTDIEQGYVEQPDNPAEFTRGLVTGRAPQ